MEKQTEHKEFIITPGLREPVRAFIEHYNTSDGRPILILGDSGTGKSLFIEIYKALYENQLKTKQNPKIKVVNCAHWIGDTQQLSVNIITL